MSFSATFYKYSKKINSTIKPPFGSQPNNYFENVKLKDDTNVLNPTLLLKANFSDLTTGKDYTPNYVHIEQFNRFYYVVNMTWVRGLWEIECKVDVLASYKDEIGAQTLYVLRSSLFSAGDIVDTTYPTTTDADLRLKSQPSPWDLTSVGSSYVVGIAGQATTYYSFSFLQLQSFLDYIFSADYAQALTTFAAVYSEIQYNANPLQFVTSIKWFPFLIGGGTVVETLRTGFVDVPVYCRELNAPFLFPITSVLTLTHRHPQVSRGSYLNHAPYSRYSLTFPPYGEFDLDAVNIASTNSILFDIDVDLRTGGSTLTVKDASQNRMNRLHADVGVDYQTTQNVSKGYGVAQVANAGLGLVASVASRDVSGAVGSVTGAIEDYAKSKIPKATTIGSNGGVDALFGSIVLQSTFLPLVNEDKEHKGRPLCTLFKIGDLSGFIQVETADVDIATMQGEQDEIKSYMEGGFYYE